MESKVNYTVVGLFVLILGIALVMIPLWLSAGFRHQEYDTYAVFMSESVDGLSTNAPVKYNGVSVGYVKSVRLNLENTQQVQILLNIRAGVPITTHTTASLNTQGLTGVTYIGLKGGDPKGALPLVASHEQPYPVIKAVPSLLLRLDTVLTEAIDNANKLTDTLNNVLNKDNQLAITNMLLQINKLSNNLAISSERLPAITNNWQNFSQQVQQNPSILVRGTASIKPGPGE